MSNLPLLRRTALCSASFAALFAASTPAFAQATQPVPGQPVGTLPAQCDDDDTTALPACRELQQETVNADGSNPQEEGAIVVTGSRIPRPQFEGTIPGAQVTQEQIETRGFTSALEVLNDIPLVGPGASPLGNAGGQPASLGASFVDLLDLGTNRTLTLVNGRRFVSGNAGTLFVAGNVTGSQVDLNVIPTALIERIDVLTVGGAVAYGSDAISGVVNAILRDDYEGYQTTFLAGISERGDGAAYRVSTLGGWNFAGDRGNIAFAVEYNRDDALIGTQRDYVGLNPIAPTFFGNGGVRNQGFQGAVGLPGGNAFLPNTSDLVPNNVAGTGFFGGSILTSLPGAIFQSNAAINALPGFQGIATGVGTAANAFRPGVLINQAGNVNLVPGTPIATGNGCDVANLTTFCTFAPTALPGTGAAQTSFANAVVARFAPTQVGQGTQAQRNALALQLLQQNRPTPREFLINNPNTNIGAFIGTTIPNFLDVANPDPATAAALPRIAVPLQFNDAGNIVSIIPGIIADPRVTPGTTGGAVTPDGYNPARFTNLRVQQDRWIANLFAKFDLTDRLTLYTENLYARVENVSPTNAASTNVITSGTTENAALVMNINNPFLDADDRRVLAAAGVTGPFVLSRQNQDIVGDNPARVESDTYRTVIGLRGTSELFGRELRYDTSFTYGRAEFLGRSQQIKDIEYALAVDAVDEGLARRGVANGNIVCRAQINPAAVVGTTPTGVVGLEVVREPDANGVIVERTIRRVATAEQVANCRPLNVFGYNQFSAEAGNYVRANTGFTNVSDQYFVQGILSGSFVDLPGGPLGFAITGDYRRESLSYAADELSRTGATRTAALASTSGFIEAIEVGGELRIPIFGDDFNIPLFRNLDITPGVRVVRQSGDAPDVRLLSGRTQTFESQGEAELIYSIAGSWRPIRDITIRGNYTRSVRQPSIVELFLGGQPAFSAVTDPCAPANIGLGVRPAVRRANCQAAATALGLPANFLETFVPSGTGIQGSFAGSPDLAPEKGRSFTVGAAFQPRFLPGFRFSADYINVEVRDQIIPTSILTALNVCYDSPAFPDTSPEVGVNTCSFFSRIPGTAAERRFEVDNGFNSGFINLGALKVRAVNITSQYDTSLDNLFGNDAGSLQLFANVYWLMDYLNSPAGTFEDTQPSDGTFTQPEVEVQVRARYENDGFYFQWTTFWQPETQIFSAGAPINIETQDVLGNPAYSLHDATVGVRFGEEEQFGLQLVVNNVFDNQFAGNGFAGFAQPNGITLIDRFGRRFRVSASLRF